MMRGFFGNGKRRGDEKGWEVVSWGDGEVFHTFFVDGLGEPFLQRTNTTGFHLGTMNLHGRLFDVRGV